jgi:hypothetical protein
MSGAIFSVALSNIIGVVLTAGLGPSIDVHDRPAWPHQRPAGPNRPAYLRAVCSLYAVSTIPAFSMNQYAVAHHPASLSWIQIANRVGATAIALTRRNSKRQALLDAGATHVVATDEQDLVKKILGLTGGKGARVVVDPVGGPTMEKLVRVTMPHGIVFIYGP